MNQPVISNLGGLQATKIQDVKIIGFSKNQRICQKEPSLPWMLRSGFLGKRMTQPEETKGEAWSFYQPGKLWHVYHNGAQPPVTGKVQTFPLKWGPRIPTETNTGGWHLTLSNWNWVVLNPNLTVLMSINKSWTVKPLHFNDSNIHLSFWGYTQQTWSRWR